MEQQRRRLKDAHGRTNKLTSKQQQRHKGLYEKRCRGSEMDVGNLLLVRQTAWKEGHMLQDRWEDEEYWVIAQHIPGIPAYKMQSFDSSKSRILHTNLLLQGNLWWDDWFFMGYFCWSPVEVHRVCLGSLWSSSSSKMHHFDVLVVLKSNVSF